MGKRRAGRDLALKLLFQIDIAATPWQEALETARRLHPVDEETELFTRRLVEGTLASLSEIDELLAKYANEWPLERMANVDRSLLRMAVYEILNCPDIPASVSIDEAVELAKKYSTAESGKFINGILGSLLRALSSDAVRD